MDDVNEIKPVNASDIFGDADDALEPVDPKPIATEDINNIFNN